MPRRIRLAALLLPLLLAAACGDDSEETSAGAAASGSGGSDAGSGGSGNAAATGGSGAVTDDFEAGGDRPVTVLVPEGYDASTPAPLLILLHGYSASGFIQNTYFQMESVANARGIIYAYPDGTIDGQGNHFWNATDACCNFFGSTVDDVAYLLGLVDEIASKVNVDDSRIYFIGHSNGGFMSYRLACEASDRIAAIASLAGANFADPADCKAQAPVSVLQIHGDMDDTVPYAGGTLAGTTIPSALESVAHFAALAGCDAMATAGAPIDVDTAIEGAESTVQTFAGCDTGYAEELWTIQGGGHIPNLDASFSEMVVDFLLAHPKP